VTLSDRIASIRKAVVAFVGVLTALLAANLLPENVAGLVSSVVGFLTVVLTYWVPNAQTDNVAP
jgi:nitrate/nitrite transporter NarK